MSKIKVLAVHGVGGHADQGVWKSEWTQGLRDSLHRVDPTVSFDIEFVNYDDIFSDEDITTFGTLEAVTKLVGSGIWHGIYMGRAYHSEQPWREYRCSAEFLYRCPVLLPRFTC